MSITIVIVYHGLVPRVTEKYRQRQRLAITVAARLCFAHRGFYATTMDEIIAQAGMSPNTVYRYFPSKDALVQAVCVQKTEEIAARIGAMAAQASAGPAPTPGAVFTIGVRSLTHPTAAPPRALAVDDETQVAHLMLNIWAQMFTDPKLRATVGSAFRNVHAAITQIARLWERDGRLAAGLDADTAARTVWRSALGYITDKIVSGAADLDATAHDLDTLILGD